MLLEVVSFIVLLTHITANALPFVGIPAIVPAASLVSGSKIKIGNFLQAKQTRPSYYIRIMHFFSNPGFTASIASSFSYVIQRPSQNLQVCKRFLSFCFTGSVIFA